MIKPLLFENSGFYREEWQRLSKLRTPAQIQDFINSLPFNFEKKGETHHSVRETLKAGVAHCFEGALLAATCLWIQGERPLLLDLKADRPDLDHVVTIFKKGKKYGAISKTNHSVLRYREPVYKSVRELAMSYFHEYFLFDGRKTLRSFSKPFALKPFAKHWLTGSENLAWLAHELDVSPHTSILSSKEAHLLRKADPLERKVSEISEY
jgi:hypothetical protein